MRWMLALALLLSACGTTPPTPDPHPGPADAAAPYLFDKLVADCDAASAQSPSVLSPVKLCLARYDQAMADMSVVDSCVLDLLTTWPADAIACGVRAIGVEAAISVAGGDAGACDRSVAPAAMRFLRIHDVQFRN